jgi:hypothetical protein
MQSTRLVLQKSAIRLAEKSSRRFSEPMPDIGSNRNVAFERHHMIGDERYKGKKVHVAVKIVLYHKSKWKNTRQE